MKIIHNSKKMMILPCLLSAVMISAIMISGGAAPAFADDAGKMISSTDKLGAEQTSLASKLVPPWMDPTPPGCPYSIVDPLHLFDNECLYNPYADVPAPAGHTAATTLNWIGTGHFYSWSALGHTTTISRNWSNVGHTATLTGMWVRRGHTVTATQIWAAAGHGLLYTLAGHTTQTSNAWLSAGHELEPTIYWSVIGHNLTPSFAWQVAGHDFGISQAWEDDGHATVLTQDWIQNGHDLTATREIGYCRAVGPEGLPVC